MKKANAVVRSEMRAWFRECLGCVAGRREFALGRYMVTVFDDTDTGESVLDTYRRFCRSVIAYDNVACMLVFNNPCLYADAGRTVREAISYLANQIAPLSFARPSRLVTGGRIGRRHAIKCPVTGELTVFDDFDAIAFCLQADNRQDPLYDPLMAAPYPCVNISSDVFAFSMLTRDRFIARHNREIFGAQCDDVVSRHLIECGAVWQSFAVRTIRNYVAMTDTTLCPTYLSADRRYWYANHQDPSFAESEKRLHRHEMPVAYTPEIISTWERRMRVCSMKPMANTNPGESP